MKASRAVGRSVGEGERETVHSMQVCKLRVWLRAGEAGQCLADDHVRTPGILELPNVVEDIVVQALAETCGPHHRGAQLEHTTQSFSRAQPVLLLGVGKAQVELRPETLRLQLDGATEMLPCAVKGAGSVDSAVECANAVDVLALRLPLLVRGGHRVGRASRAVAAPARRSYSLDNCHCERFAWTVARSRDTSASVVSCRVSTAAVNACS